MVFLRFLLISLALLAAPAAQAASYRLVALGDSLTAGYGLGPGEAYPAKLQSLLRSKGKQVEIRNAGVSGDTSTGGLERLDWSVPDGTDGVILCLGANDMLRGIAPDITQKNLAAIVAKLKERKIAVMLVGLKAAPNLGADYAKAFEAIFPKLAEAEDLVFMPFLLEGVAANPALNLSDGMHPNGQGTAIIANTMLPYIDSFLGKLTR